MDCYLKQLKLNRIKIDGLPKMEIRKFEKEIDL